MQKYFLNIVPVVRPVVPLRDIDPNWLVGFVDAEGCFSIISPKGRTNQTFWLLFQVTQHSRDTLLIDSLINFFGCGSTRTRSTKLGVDFRVTSASLICSNIIPFFKNYELQSLKQFDFNLFCEAAELILNKGSLSFSSEELSKISSIKDRINKKDLIT